MGRHKNDEIRIDDPRVSRGHAFVEVHPTHLAIRSRKLMSVNGIEVDHADIRPGDRVALREVSLIAMSEPMVRALPHLDRMVGAGSTVGDMLAMPPAAHAVLLGVPHAPLLVLALLQHEALAPSTPYFEATLSERLSEIRGIAAALPLAHGGRIFLDGRRRDAKGRAVGASPTEGLLDQLAAPDQRTALTLGLHMVAEINPSILRRGCRLFVIPSVPERLADAAGAGREQLIDSTLAHLGTSWHAAMLHPDLVHALASCTWVTGDYLAFEAVLAFAHCAWTNDDQGADRLHERHPRRLTRWLNELGVDWMRLRDWRPTDALPRRAGRGEREHDAPTNPRRRR